MLTRIQVARRLGRSVATVRRLEGTELHPHRDGRGTHRFAADEVETLADRLMATGSLSAVRTSASLEEPWKGHREREEQLLVDIERLRGQLAGALNLVDTERQILTNFKARVARVLLELGRELCRFEPTLGEIVLAAIHELEE